MYTKYLNENHDYNKLLELSDKISSFYEYICDIMYDFMQKCFWEEEFAFLDTIKEKVLLIHSQITVTCDEYVKTAKKYDDIYQAHLAKVGTIEYKDDYLQCKRKSVNIRPDLNLDVEYEIINRREIIKKDEFGNMVKDENGFLVIEEKFTKENKIYICDIKEEKLDNISIYCNLAR